MSKQVTIFFYNWTSKKIPFIYLFWEADGQDLTYHAPKSQVEMFGF